MNTGKPGEQLTTNDVIDGIDLTGRVAAVTGASGGLGAETARALASAGAEVILLARDKAKTEATMAAIRDRYPDARLRWFHLELGDLEAVRATASEVLARYPAIHLLINNAAIMACPFATTAQGFESQFGTNHLGHFLLTNLLRPALAAGAPARVVNVSSSGHHMGGIDFGDPNFRQREYHKWQAYGQAKSANALFALALNNRGEKLGIKSWSLHPGAINTDLGRHLLDEDMALLAEVEESGLTWKSIPQGAATQVWAAISPELAEDGGRYLEDCAIARPFTPDRPMQGYMPHIADPEAAERLWRLSEQLVGESFPWPP